MKNLIIFLSGCIVGSVGTLIYLRKDIEARIEAMNAETKESSEETDSDDELPFTVGKGGESERTSGGKTVNTEKMKYDSLVRKTMSSDDLYEDEEETNDPDENDPFYEELKKRPQFEPIHDMGDFNDPAFDTESYVFFRGDNVFCTDSGTIVDRPALLVGTDWMNWIGEVRPNTALVRDNKRIKSIDILVEDGLYSDEYGDYIKED